MSTVDVTNLARHRRKNGLKSTLLHRFFLSIHLFRLSDGVIEQMLARHGSTRRDVLGEHEKLGLRLTSPDLAYIPIDHATGTPQPYRWTCFIVPTRTYYLFVFRSFCYQLFGQRVVFYLILLSEFPKEKIKLFRWVEKLIYCIILVKIKNSLFFGIWNKFYKILQSRHPQTSEKLTSNTFKQVFI